MTEESSIEMNEHDENDPSAKAGDSEAREQKADETLRDAGIDPDTVGDITDPEQWRKMPKEGGGA